MRPWLYLAFPLALLMLFFIIPTGMAFYISLFDYSQHLYHPQFVGLANYQTLLTQPHFWQVAWNTLLFTGLTVPAMLTLPIILALLVNHQLKGITLFRTLIYLPVIVSVVVAGIAWKWLYASDGLINYLLSFLHIPKTPWLTAPEFAMVAIVIMVVWKGLGYYMMMYLASLQSISSELYESAQIDGANTFQSHWHITVPHLRPTMAMIALVSTIGALKVFTEMYVMTRGGPVGSTETMVYYIYEQAFGQLNLGLASAAGWLLVLVLLGLSLIQIQTVYLKAEDELKHA